MFLRALPKLIDEAVVRWQLSDLQPEKDLSYNYITYGRSGGADVVLKLGVPDKELTSEIHALRHFAGRGAVRLVDADSGRGMLLMERVQPGEKLASVSDDVEATRIAADVMLALLRTAPEDDQLIHLSDWFQGFERFRKQNGGTGPLAPALFEEAEHFAREIMEEEHRPTLLHGDLHHSNILSSGGRWVAIDPKGVVGPAVFEVGPFLLNPRGAIDRRPDAAEVLRSRIDILSEMLGIQKQRIRRCGILYAVLSAVWSLEEGKDWRPAMECGRQLADLGE